VERAVNGCEAVVQVRRFYTVLTEGDLDQQDPIADALGRILDGTLFCSGV